MLPWPILPQTIKHVSIVSLCVCAPSSQFVSNYSISKSIRRVSPAVLVVTGRTLDDVSQILKYADYYVVISAENTHILLQKNEEVFSTGVASSKESVLTVDAQVKGLKFRLVAASGIRRNLLVDLMQDNQNPLVVSGLFAGNPFSEPSQRLLASLGATLISKDVLIAGSGSRRTKSPSFVPAIVLQNMVSHGTGTYVTGSDAPGPLHLWGRVGA